MNINDDYKYTEEWEELGKVNLEPESLYLYGGDPEDRSEHCAHQLEGTNPQCRFVKIFYNEDDTIFTSDRKDENISLSATDKFESFFELTSESLLYIDVTGLSCRVIAPVLQYALKNEMNVRVVYVEPENYKIDMFRQIGINKDLCETIRGINPLPGMAHIVPHRDSPLFVVLLGFEGGRFSHIVQNQSPDYNKIIPVIGVPGYQINYPYVSLLGNKYPLQNTRSWQRMHYAEANSIVDVYMLLKKLGYDHRDAEMVVAPLGTKPHAVGSILYSITHPDKVEIIYDNPNRSVHRTEGIGRVLVCDVSKLVQENGRS